MYKTYILGSMYTITQFRDNIRQAFTNAELGKPVIIKRYNKTFELKVVEEK